MLETWTPISGYEGVYEVSNTGLVRSIDRVVTCSNGVEMFRRGKELKTSAVGTSGHKTVHLCQSGKAESKLVHRLVLEAFVGECPEGNVGCHNNGIATDNRLENLRWDTPSANAQDCLSHGNHNFASMTHCTAGHEYTAGNTYMRPGRNERVCRICADVRRADWAAKKVTA